MRAAAVTISTSRAAGAGEDGSGPALEALARELGATQVLRELLGDEREPIEACLRRLCDEQRCALILTSGGTGFAPNDVTPEATRAVLRREAPGLAEAMRLASRPHTPNWMLSRALAGTRGETLIVNLPGNPRAIGQVGAELAPALLHALGLIEGRPHAV